MPRIRSIAIVEPKYRYSTKEIQAFNHTWLDEAQEDSFSRLTEKMLVGGRNFVLPITEVLSLTSQKERAHLFSRHGIELGRTAVKHLEGPIDGLKNLIFTSCTMPLIPSPDVEIILQTGIPRNITRVPIYQYGCGGSAAALSLCTKLSPTLLLSIELCSLLFYKIDPLIGPALFADGAAAAIIDEGTSGLIIKASQSFLIPDSAHLMGYDIEDDGAHLRLDRLLPEVLTEHILELILNFSVEQNFSLEEIKGWLIHPGGPKLLRLFEHTFSLQKDQTKWSWQILEKYGNMSSATLLYVIDAYMKSHKAEKGEKALVVGIGPGLSVYLILLQNE